MGCGIHKGIQQQIDTRKNENQESQKPEAGGFLPPLVQSF